MTLTHSDIRLLQLLQHDATLSQTDLAERAGMSRTSCWRRIRDLESAGIIDRRVTLIDAEAAGYQILVLLSVSMKEHTDENRRSFERHVAGLEPVMECFSVSGDRDYVLQIVARDMASYNEFLNAEILKHPAVLSASSTFALRRVKYTTELPLSD